jgi:16S rRNA (cytosine1402-N4)-methyltransferase
MFREVLRRSARPWRILDSKHGGSLYLISPGGARHTPVLLQEVVGFLFPEGPSYFPKGPTSLPEGPGGLGRVYLDATLGDGGHAEAILQASAPTGRLIGMDRDQEAVKVALERLSEYGDRVILAHEHFARMADVLEQHHIQKVDGIIFDLGVSSRQLMQADRGFSFQFDGPLDMRMDRSQPIMAEELIRRLSEKELADIIFRYGQERWSRRIAKAIVQARKRQSIKTTRELVEIIQRVVPRGRSHFRLHPATRTFQALRIAINQELDHLEAALDEACRLLNFGGRLCVIAFHSLEDRIVKQTLRRLSSQAGGGMMRILTRKPLQPSPAEIRANPRSRSAKLRAAERISG